MFKEALGALTSSVVGATKQSLSEYKPTAQNMGGAFTRIAQQGIANLSYRSPIFADLAATMLHNFQAELVNRDKIKQYVGSDQAKDLRESVKSQLGDKASPEKIDREMFNIISKLEKLVDKEGAKASNNDFFKKNEEHYKKFLDSFKKDSEQSKGSGGDSNSPEVLQRIEANTLHTVQALNNLQAGEGHGAAPTGTPTNNPSNSGAGFIDPLTGMPSIRAAVGSIGGSFLAKVFDDETISKYAEKARNKLFGEKKSNTDVQTPEAKKKIDEISGLVTPEFKPKSDPKIQPTHQESVSSILKDLSLDLSAPTANVEDKKESESIAAKAHGETKNLQEKVVEQLQALNEKTGEKKEETTSIFGTLTKMLGEFSPMLGKIIPVLSSVGSVLMAIAPAVGAVGLGAVAGVAIGTAAKETIDYGIRKTTGDENASLGSKIYDMFNDDPMAEPKSKYTPPKRASRIMSIDKMETQKAQKAASGDSQTVTTPVAINSTTNNSSNTNVIVGSSVRNQESTYERVQMNNYWAGA